MPLWAAAITVALWGVGFRPLRHAGRRPEPPRLAGPSAGHAFSARYHDRGRDARTPADIPPRGWRDILLRVWHNIGRDRVVLVAAGITFYAILSLFPAIAALVSLYGVFADPTTMAGHVDSLAGLLPEGAITVVKDQVDRVAAQGRQALGLTFVAGLAMSLWSANAGIKSLFDGLNLVYKEEEERGIVKLNLVSLSFTTAAIGLGLISVAAIVVVPLVLDFLGLTGGTAGLLAMARWPTLLLVVAIALAVLYRYGPSRATAQWRWVSRGSAFAALAWLAASLMFSWYAANFGSYNKTYGSLGAVIGFMTWIWLSAIVVLIGAEIDAEMEHQTGRDTTTGSPKPLGTRRATMADTIGETP